MKFNDFLIEKDGIIKGPFGGDVKKSLFVPKGENTYKVYEQGVVASQDFKKGSYYLPKEYVDKKLSRFFIKEGDILITGAGTLGLMAVVPENIETGIINQALIRIRLNEDIIYKPFFKYYFAWAIRDYASRINGNSVIPNLPPIDVLKEIEVELPSMPEQKKIASHLDLINSKISNNNAICTDLEVIAKQLYDYWFVQFDFPDENGKPYKSSGGKMVWNEELKRNIPDRWEVKPLSDVFCITMGSSPSGASLNENGEGIEFYQGSTDFGDLYPTERVYTTAPVRFAKAQDVLLSVRAPVGDMNIAMNDCCIGRGLAAIHHNCTLYAWCSMLSLRPYFDIYNGNGTTFGALTSDDLKGKLTVCPQESVLNSFVEKVNPISQELRLLSKETQQLASLRDFLLPMLMNGQVKIKE